MTALGPARFETLEDQSRVLVTLPDGRSLHVTPERISRQRDGQFWLNVPLRELQIRLAEQREGLAEGGAREQVVIPVVEEEYAVGKRQVETGKVRLRKLVHELEEMLESTSRHERVEIEREPVNEFVDRTENMTYEDDRLVIPIYEEVVVTEKRLLLKERVIVTIREVEEHHSQPVTRRVEEVMVERVPAGHEGEAAGRDGERR